MNERIVYVLGAGFSAPLGLPLVGNFIFKSKDMFFENRERFASFDEVFQTLHRLSRVKNYFNADLFNIEEVLSLIEMESFLEHKKLSDGIVTYIKEVISFYTPAIPPMQGLCANWDSVWAGSGVWSLYLRFVAHLLRLKLQFTEASGRVAHVNCICRSRLDDSISYQVVSLNYDRLIEMACDHLSTTFPSDISHKIDPSRANSTRANVPLVKLHGCVSSTIVPPTWNKGAHPGIAKDWANAYEAIRNATQLRFIGYSLPDSDAYVRYLLKTACSNAAHLKRIDVICLDPDSSVRQRYERVFNFRDLKFSPVSIEEYLGGVAREAASRDGDSVRQRNELTCDHLERTHAQLISADVDPAESRLYH